MNHEHNMRVANKPGSKNTETVRELMVTRNDRNIKLKKRDGLSI